MKFALYILFLLLSTIANAQTKKGRNLLKVANQEYNNLRFSYSIPFYKKYLSIYPNDTLALKNMASAYKNVNQYDSALKYIDKAVSLGHKSYYLLPELLATVKKYDAAIINYSAIPDSVKTKIVDARIYGFKNLSKFYTDTIDYKVHNTILNTPFNEYNVVPYNSGLIFESNRLPIKKRRFNLFNLFKKYEFGWDGAGYTKLYFRSNVANIRTDSVVNFNWTDKRLPRSVADYTPQTSNDNNKFYGNYDIKNVKYNDSAVSLFKFQVGLKYNIGSVSFTSDGIRAYYTRNQLKSNGVKKLEIWESRFVNNKWTRGYKMFFNNKNYSYFHPAVTPDGKRLYYVSDEPTGLGGTDIYYIEKNNDGSWKATNNLGQVVNTEGNELFPTFYDGLFCFSSNGHPGLGGLDIYRVEANDKDEFVVKNLGYPINSTTDDLAFYMSDNAGYFSSNRNGSDDIFAFDYKKALVKISGQILTDFKKMGNTKVYLYSYDENGKKILEDSSFLDANSNYAFNTRPNQKFEVAVYDKYGNKHEIEVNSDNYIKTNDEYNKSIALLNLPVPEEELKEIKLKEEAIRNAELAKLSKQFVRTIDSLKSLTTDYVELHHPFDQVYIIKKDLNDYYKLIERVKSMKGKKIIIVSAADCNGALEYNEDLSLRRAKRIFKSLSNSFNTTMIKQVGERELLKDCSDARKDIEEQVINRYSYIFILNK
jgi:outer membrane protein OmpA-like peptidoglycan-associated protein